MSILKINVPTTLDKMVELSNIQASPFDGKTWYVEVIPCSTPTCTCENVNLLFRDEHQVNTRSYSFYIAGDLAEKKMKKLSFDTAEGDLSTLSKSTMLLEEELTADDWEALITVHKVSKGALIDDSDLKKVEVDFSIEQLNNPSSVVLFQDVFPLASYFYFDKKDNIPYLALDQYCANHKCTCSYVVLTFSKDGRHEDFAFRYDYNKDTVELLEAFRKDVSLQEAKNYVRLLKEKFKDFNKKLKKRNEIMRHLFKKYTIRMNAQLIKNNRVSGQKVSRNAPCPCGSGKKYKRCCGKKLRMMSV